MCISFVNVYNFKPNLELRLIAFFLVYFTYFFRFSLFGTKNMSTYSFVHCLYFGIGYQRHGHVNYVSFTGRFLNVPNSFYNLLKNTTAFFIQKLRRFLNTF